MLGLVPAVLPLMWIVARVVQLAFGAGVARNLRPAAPHGPVDRKMSASVARAALVQRADPAVAIDRSHVHSDRRELAVERREHALPARPVRDGQRSTFHPVWNIETRDRAERRREVDEAHWFVDRGWCNTCARGRAPDQRNTQQ